MTNRSRVARAARSGPIAEPMRAIRGALKRNDVVGRPR
jgi:hypothetical protein